MRQPYDGLIALVVLWPCAAAAQTETGTLNVTIGGMARLSLSSTSITFPDSDPDTVPQIAALPGPVTITARGAGTPGRRGDPDGTGHR